MRAAGVLETSPAALAKQLVGGATMTNQSHSTNAFSPRNAARVIDLDLDGDPTEIVAIAGRAILDQGHPRPVEETRRAFCFALVSADVG